MKPTFTKVTLFTDTDGRARFREDEIEFSDGTPQMQLTPSLPSKSCQLRYSPVGFEYDFHCTDPVWVIILGGQMEILLQDGSSRLFNPGDCFYAVDGLPAGANFDEKVHGHRSRQVGPDPLVTFFVEPQIDLESQY